MPDWNQDLAVGVTEIDRQHQELFAKINRLLAACNQGRGREEVGQVIGFLEDYVVSHFAAEEKYMVKYQYPEYQAHKGLHDQFVQDFTALKKEFEEKGAGITFTLRINHVVVEWLLNHISKVDKSMGGFLKSKLAAGSPKP